MKDMVLRRIRYDEGSITVFYWWGIEVGEGPEKQIDEQALIVPSSQRHLNTMVAVGSLPRILSF